MFNGVPMSSDMLDEAVEEKGQLIDKLNKLDEGFDIMYQNLAAELKGNRGRYASQIKELQEKIKKVTDMSVSVQAQEARNKKLIEEYFANARAGVGRMRKSSKAAYDYYKSMSGAGLQTARFLDDKK